MFEGKKVVYYTSGQSTGPGNPCAELQSTARFPDACSAYINGMKPYAKVSTDATMTQTTTRIERVGSQTDVLGESPVWDTASEALYWVDIRGPAVRRYDWASKQIESWTMPELVGSLAVRKAGGLLLALQSGLAFFEPATGRLDRLVSVASG